MGNGGPTILGFGTETGGVITSAADTGHIADPLEVSIDPIDPRGKTALLEVPTAQDIIIEGAGKPAEEVRELILDGRYRIHNTLKNTDMGGSVIGAGGMGTVFLAEDLKFKGSKVAVKIMNSAIARTDEQIRRFDAEASVLALLDHTNIIKVTDRGETPDRRLYFVMEYAKGKSLAQVKERNGRLFTWEETKDIVLQICNAVSAAHENNIVHRDLKPENILLIERVSRPYLVKVLDFGIAKRTDLGPEQRRLTQTGMVFGTALYMSPEQAKGKNVDHRSDIYSLGIIMYEMLTGKVPFGDGIDDFVGILSAHMTQPPQPLKEANPHADVSQEIEQIIFKALAKKPDNRFQSVLEMEEAIKATKPTKQSPTLMGLTALEEPDRETIAIRKKIVSGTRRLLFIVTGLIVAVTGGAGLYHLIGNSDGKTKQSVPLKPQPKPDAGQPVHQPVQSTPTPVQVTVKPDTSSRLPDQGASHSPDQTSMSTPGTPNRKKVIKKPKLQNGSPKAKKDPKLDILKNPEF